MIKIKVTKNGKEYFADGDKVFAWLMERYLKNQGKKAKAKLEPYKERVDNFFDSLKTTELDWYKQLKDTFPAIDIDFALKRAKLWLSSNYKKDFKKFIVNWMGRENPTIQIEQKQERQERRPSTIINKDPYKGDYAEPMEIKDILKNFKGENDE